MLKSSGTKHHDVYADVIRAALDSTSEILVEKIKESASSFSVEQQKSLVAKLGDNDSKSLDVFYQELLQKLASSAAKEAGTKMCLPIRKRLVTVEVDYDDTFTSTQAAARLNNSVNKVKKEISALNILGYKDKSRTKIPIWQFDRSEVIPGVGIILKKLGINGVVAVRTFSLELEEYGGQCIIDALLAGNTNLSIEMLETIEEGRRHDERI
jgi:hypothetical protein